MSGRDPQNQDPQNQGGTRNSLLEWTVAGLGLILVVSAAGFMLLKTADTHAPPDVHLHVLGVTASSGGYLVKIEARNTGDEAAAELSVEGTAQLGGTREISSATFDFLPPDSVREGGLFFSGDPRGSLTLRVLGYREP